MPQGRGPATRAANRRQIAPPPNAKANLKPVYNLPGREMPSLGTHRMGIPGGVRPTGPVSRCAVRGFQDRKKAEVDSVTPSRAEGIRPAATACRERQRFPSPL